MKILIIKFRNIGDVLLASPMASALAEMPENPEIFFLVKKGTEDMLTDNPFIHKVLILPEYNKEPSLFKRIKKKLQFFKQLRQQKFDISINTTEGDHGIILSFISGAQQRIGYLKKKDKWWRKVMLTDHHAWKHEKYHTVLRNLELIKHLTSPKSINVNFYFSYNDYYYVKKLLLKKIWDGKKDIVHIHPTSRWFFKCSEDAYIAEIIDFLQEKGNIVVITCAPEKKEREKLNNIVNLCHTNPIDLGGLLSLKQMGALSSIAQFFLGVDSAPMHIAAGVNTKCIALFGPSGAFEWGPWPNNWTEEKTPYTKKNGIQYAGRHLVVQQNWACVPCGKDGCNGSKKSDCLNKLNPNMIKQYLLTGNPNNKKYTLGK